jgi:hypothetical protein
LGSLSFCPGIDLLTQVVSGRGLSQKCKETPIVEAILFSSSGKVSHMRSSTTYHLPFEPKRKHRRFAVSDLDKAGCRWLKQEMQQAIAELKAAGYDDPGLTIGSLLVQAERHEANLKASRN